MLTAKPTDNDDFEAFFRANYSKAYFLALSLLHDEEASRDVVSDAFEQMISIGETDEGNNKCNASYLLTMVRNKSLNHMRRQQSFSRYASTVLHTQPRDDADDMSRLEWFDKVEDIMAALDELTPKTQQAVKACFVERKKYSEAAEDMGISKSAVKKHIMQGLSYLRKKFVV